MSLTQLAASLTAAAAKLNAIGRGEVPPDVPAIDAYRAAWVEIEDAIGEIDDWPSCVRQLSSVGPVRALISIVGRRS